MSESQPRATRRSVAGRLGDWVLNVTAVLGTICILATIAAFVFGIQIALFKTGSMAPAIPAGSAAITKEIPAAEAEVGDVVTVSRGEGKLPITHRVVESAPTGGGAALLVLKGDANADIDPFPYEVEKANKVLFSIPGIGSSLSNLGSAQVIGVITIFATFLVVWAFWPRPEVDEAQAHAPVAEDKATPSDDDETTSGTPESRGNHTFPAQRDERPLAAACPAPGSSHPEATTDTFVHDYGRRDR